MIDVHPGKTKILQGDDDKPRPFAALSAPPSVN